jgi:nucleoside-triphosphatase THEP1
MDNDKPEKQNLTNKIGKYSVNINGVRNELIPFMLTLPNEPVGYIIFDEIGKM